MKIMISLSSPELVNEGFTGNNGVYVFVTPLPASIEVLTKIAGKLGFDPDPDKFHVTVMYSTETPGKVRADYNTTHIAVIDRVEIFTGHDGKSYLSAQLISPDLQRLHDKWRKLGAVHSFDELMPHVTIWADVEVTPELEAKVLAVNSDLIRRPHLCFLSGETATDLKD